MTALEDNISKLDGYLEPFRHAGIMNRIAGQNVAGGGRGFSNKFACR